MMSISLSSMRPVLAPETAMHRTGVRAPRLALIMLVLCGATFVSVAHANPENPLEDRGMAEHTSDYVQDYLSDRRRVGALAGSILGGALTAHPAGTVIGSIIGFLIGKQTMFEDYGAQSKAQSLAAARRDIVPQDGQGQNPQTLSFANAHGISFDSPPASAAIVQQAPPVQVAPTLPAATAASAAMVATPAAGPVPAATPAPAPSRPAPAVLARSAPDVPKVDQAPVVSVYAGTPPPAALAAASPFSVPRGFSRELIAQMCSSRGALPADPRLRTLCFYNQSN